jgi:uncharacterized membrane protein YphA (DoxX/SURF4 family)
MLNPFPIQFLSLLAYLILRVIAGFVLIVFGYRHFKARTELSQIMTLPFFPFGGVAATFFILAELVVGTLFILGMHTQFAALVLIAMSLKMMVLRPKFNHPSIPSRFMYLLFFAIGCSLFITGAGALAFDLPI